MEEWKRRVPTALMVGQGRQSQLIGNAKGLDITQHTIGSHWMNNDVIKQMFIKHHRDCHLRNVPRRKPGREYSKREVSLKPREEFAEAGSGLFGQWSAGQPSKIKSENQLLALARPRSLVTSARTEVYPLSRGLAVESLTGVD